LLKLTLDNVKSENRRVLDILNTFKSFFGLIVIFAIASFICVRNGRNLFLSASNLGNVARAVSENGIMAIGMTLVILFGGIDLSVGAILGLTATASASLLIAGNSTFVAVLLVLVMSAVFGLFNGIVSTKLGVQAFIVTLASMSMARGIARFLSGGQGVPIAYGTGPGQVDPLFQIFSSRIFSTETFTGVPVPAIVFLLLAVTFSILLKYTRFGRHVYAVGGNETSAFLCGIKVDQLKIVVYTLCSVLAGIAGILHAAQLRQGSPNDGSGYELDAIAAVAIGGTSMAGGKGTIVGTVVGVLILGILNNMLQLNNVDINLQLVLKGLIIIAAVVLQRERKK
jgi:ribose transport system permease protein